MLRAILNKSWWQHPTRHQLYGHLPPITKTIQVRWTRHAGHGGELISDVLLWTPTYGRAKAGRPARTYIQQQCKDMGCSPEDLPEAMNDREKWRERVRDICASGTTWWLSYTQTHRSFPVSTYRQVLWLYQRRRTISRDISDTVSPPLPIVDCFWKVFKGYMPYRHQAAICRFELVILPLLSHVKGVHRSTLLMSSSLLLQQCPACLILIVFKMGGHNCCLEEIKLVFMSILLYGCITWTLTKCIDKKLDGDGTRMLWAILNKSWKQHPHKATK